MSGAQRRTRKYGKGSFYRRPADPAEPLKYWEYAKAVEDENGNRRRVKATSTLEDAQDALQECLERWTANVTRTKPLSPQKPPQRRKGGKPAPAWTLERYAEHWLTHIEATRTKDQAHALRQRITKHVLPHIGGIAVGELSQQHTEALFRGTLKNQGYSTSTLSNVRKALAQMLRHARTYEQPPLLYHDPAPASIVEPAGGRKQKQSGTELIWKRAEAAHHMLLEAGTAEAPGKEANHFTHLWLRLNFFGLRKSEQAGLLWTRTAPPDHETLKIEAQFLYRRDLRGVRYTEDLKTGNSRREIPAPAQLRAALILWKQEQDALKQRPSWKRQEHDYVLTHEDGRPFSPNDADKFWKNYKAEFFKRHPDLEAQCEPDTWTIHDNRHITASLFKDWGVPYDDARRILGHGDRAITEKIYTQVRAESLNKSVDEISDSFKSEEDVLRALKQFEGIQPQTE